MNLDIRANGAPTPWHRKNDGKYSEKIPGHPEDGERVVGMDSRHPDDRRATARQRTVECGQSFCAFNMLCLIKNLPLSFSTCNNLKSSINLKIGLRKQAKYQIFNSSPSQPSTMLLDVNILSLRLGCLGRIILFTKKYTCFILINFGQTEKKTGKK